MQDYTTSMSSLSEVQRIIGLSLSKIQIGRNQRGGLPLHKNLLVATVLNKARDLYMQETMYMNYKMMTGQLGAAQMSCMTMHAPQCSGVNPESMAPEGSSIVDEEEEEAESLPISPPPLNIHPYPEETKSSDGGAPQPPVPSRNSPSDEGFIDEPDCDCDDRNFSSESSRVPFQYCYQCAPFHPSNGRGPTLVPAAKSSLGHSPHHSSSGSEEEVVSSPNPHGGNTNAGNNFTIYDMDSKATELRSPSHSIPSRKRYLSDPSDNSGGKRSRSTSLPDESEYSHPLNEGQVASRPYSISTSNNSSEEVFHPAFRQCSQNSHQFHHGTSSDASSGSNPPPSMEIDQITSLVSIFSFGQQIMAAAAAEANKRLQQKSNIHSFENEEEREEVREDIPSEKDHHLLETKKDEDSDSESDTSSDSGHSSDDLEANSPEAKINESSKPSETPKSTTPCCSAQEGSSVVKKDAPNCCILPVAIV